MRIVRFAPELAAYGLPLAFLSMLPLFGVDFAVAGIAAIILALTHWFWRPIATSLVVVPIVVLISVVNDLKYRYTGETLIWQDLTYALPNLGNNLGTLLQYLDSLALVGLLGWLGSVVLLGRIESRYLSRSIMGSLVFVATIGSFYLSDFVDSMGNAILYIKHRRIVNAWDFSNHHHESAIGRFLVSARLNSSDLTYGMSTPEAFIKRASEIVPPISARYLKAEQPDVFVVLQESQFDISQLEWCRGRNDCLLEMFAPSKYSRQLGPLHVHVYGGGTWQSELALMTGTPHTWYQDANYSPYTVAPRIRNALGHHFASLGYRTGVVYPVQRGMMNALQTYRAYGMDSFWGAEELGLPLDWCQVTDEVMYSKLAEIRTRLLAKDNRPLFLVMLTIFNHGPYGGRCAKKPLGPKSEKSIEATVENKLNDYLQRSLAADGASSGFRKQVLDDRRPALILVAGDHQPSFEGLATALQRVPHPHIEASSAHYFTNYNFFSNFGNAERTVSKELDIVFLPSSLLELAGLPFSPIFSANRQLREICGGRLDQCPAGDFLDSYRSYLLSTGFYQ